MDLVPYDLIWTKHFYKDPIFKEGHILRFQADIIFWRGGAFQPAKLKDITEPPSLHSSTIQVCLGVLNPTAKSLFVLDSKLTLKDPGNHINIEYYFLLWRVQQNIHGFLLVMKQVIDLTCFED